LHHTYPDQVFEVSFILNGVEAFESLRANSRGDQSRLAAHD
jgi:hypothetical protein